MKRALIIFCLFPILFQACNSNSIVPNNPNEICVTGAVQDITATSATIYAYANLYSTNIKIGIVISEQKEPTTEIGKVIEATSIDENNQYSVVATYLIPNTTYYYRGYVKANSIVHYGGIKSFSTPDVSAPELVIAEPVDLGLSVKWASFNVGATKPEEYGDYFAWADTETLYEPGYAQVLSPKWKPGKESGYTLSTYKYKASGSVIDISKYNNFDKKRTLDPEDDVASTLWGGTWRTPSVKDFEELVYYCSFNTTTYNGVNGVLVTSKKNGYTDKFIFLPFSGHREQIDLYCNVTGEYWTSACKDSNAYFFYAKTKEINTIQRYKGLTIRPVCD